MTLKRSLYLILGATGLFFVYFFQDYLNFYSLLTEGTLRQLNYQLSFTEVNTFGFVLNKAGRYLLNDLFSIAIIFGIFGKRKYVRFAFYLMTFGLLVLLPVYLVLYLSQPEGFSSMLSHLHRVVMNPLLMMLLIPAFYYQERLQQQAATDK